ncbi:MAG: hypothetical protein HIU83_17675 [Proteobacteria bacterium]|nr:hypothetical protein [Pseudomonadota bacterium]
MDTARPETHGINAYVQSKNLFEHRERVLNHTLGKLDRIYNQHDFDDEKQVALETLERKINSILTKKISNVIPITSKAA